jgi:hypothetical protein
LEDTFSVSAMENIPVTRMGNTSKVFGVRTTDFTFCQGHFLNSRIIHRVQEVNMLSIGKIYARNGANVNFFVHAMLEGSICD